MFRRPELFRSSAVTAQHKHTITVRAYAMPENLTLPLKQGTHESWLLKGSHKKHTTHGWTNSVQMLPVILGNPASHGIFRHTA